MSSSYDIQPPVRETLGNVTLAVSASGNDGNPLRPAYAATGDFSSWPFATIQAALGFLNRHTGPSGYRQKIVVAASGTPYAGFTVEGFTGSGDVLLAFPMAAATLTTGPNGGTAGSGTSTVQVNQPTSAANWTVGNLRGHFMQIVSGGGASTDTDLPTTRAIKSNTTTAFIVDAVTGMDATTVFTIVSPAATVAQTTTPPLTGKVMCAIWQNNQAPMKAYGLKCVQSACDYGIYSTNNIRVEMWGGQQGQSGTVAQVRSFDDRFFKYNDFILNGSANVWVTNAQWAEVNRGTEDTATILIEECGNVTVQSDAQSCTGTAVQLQQNKYVRLGLNANSNTTTPLILYSNFRVEAQNGGWTGSSNTGYGVIFGKGGVNSTSGSTITGSLGDLFIDGTVETWSDVGSYQAIVSQYGGTTLTVNG